VPALFPAGGEITWPSNEGVLGVVGVAPWATLEFCKIFYQQVAAAKDWHYPRILIDINTKIPSRGRHLQLGEADPSPAIGETIRGLAQRGATVAVVVCNTAHVLFERWSTSLPIPVLNIVEETVRHAATSGASCIATLASKSLVASRIYDNAAERAGLSICDVEPEWQERVNDWIETVKTSGRITSEDKVALGYFIDLLRAKRVDTVLLGCTELSVLQGQLDDAGFRVIDSNYALAAAALAKINTDHRLLKKATGNVGP